MDKTEEDLMGKFNAAIDAQRFNIFEIEGFRGHPRNAILVGMALGYKMSHTECATRINELSECIKQLRQEIPNARREVRGGTPRNLDGVVGDFSALKKIAENSY